MRLDPMQRSRDFTTGRHPRRDKRSTQQQLVELNTRVTTAFDAFGGAGGAGSNLILDALPEADASYVGKTVTVTTPAGQPAGIYTGGQDTFDNPVWVPQTSADPASWVYHNTFGAPSVAITGVTATPRYVYVLQDVAGSPIAVYTHDGAAITTYNPAGIFQFQNKICYDPVNDRFGITGGTATKAGFQVFNADFSSLIFEHDTIGTGNGEFAIHPQGIAADSLGNWYVVDIANNRVQKFNSAGTYTTKWGTSGSGDGQFDYAYGIAIDADDNVHVVDAQNYRVQKFSNTGTFSLAYGSQGRGPAQFAVPSTVTRTDDGNLIVADASIRRMTAWNSSGEYITEVPFDKIGTDSWLVLDVADFAGNLFLVDVDASTGGHSLIRNFRAAGARSSSIVVANSADVISRAARILDFSSAFAVVESPSGEANIGLAAFSPASSAGAAYQQFHEDTDNGSNYVAITAPTSLAADYTQTLQAATGTVALTSDPGLILITSGSFSGVSSFSVNNCFTSTYRNYRLVFNIDSATAAAQISLRMRVGGSDHSSANYERSLVSTASSGTTVTGFGATAQTSLLINGSINGALDEVLTIDVFNPEAAFKTGYNLHTSYLSTATTTYTTITGGGGMRVTTSFDGFSLLIASGNFTGAYRVYGYRNS